MKAFFKDHWFLVYSILFMWMKTYIIYQFGFQIRTANLFHEWLLLINPLSFLLPLFGIALFLNGTKQKVFLLTSNFILTAILISNSIFYGFYIDFITIPVLFQAKNMGDMGSSMTELFHPLFILMLIDFVVLAWLLKRKPTARKASFKTIKTYYAICVGFLLFHVSSAMIDHPRFLTSSYDREVIVRNLGLFQFHLYDGVAQTARIGQKAFADEDTLSTVANYTKADYSAPNEEYFGLAKGKNVVFISLESTQQFVMDQKVNGQEITPFLNQLAKKSFYFDEFYQQTEQGKTSDSEFIVANSLYPSSSGAVFFTASDNEYDTLYKQLKKENYQSVQFHANNNTFWNRDVMYQSFGIDRFYDVESFDVNEENSTGWGLKDIDFFDQSIDYLKKLKAPYYSTFITLTNHFPFEIDPKDQFIDEYDSSSEILNRYVTTVRYQDEAIKKFFTSLKEEGMYEDTMFVLMGDHYGISEAHHEAMAELLKQDEITPFDAVKLQRVPFLIYIPGVTDQAPQKISETAGQIDVKPTILHLLGVESKNSIQFGNDLFSNERTPFTVLRNGNFITDDYLYTKNTCYDQKTKEPVEEIEVCQPFIEKANKELSLSDKVINGNLLRFYQH
ncbi:LTA synthase family protein [Bacillus sp. 179-C3.3 HS]|uniref:LTA synthase family protein n=1 Tax=Bacillus sp. 179-C3.3 HS TaxID=3232162 RepID=UPI0039A08925